MASMSRTREIAAGTINGRQDGNVRFGYFRTISRETLSIPIKNMDIWDSRDHSTAQMLQKESLEKNTPSLFGEKAASITGTVATHIQKSMNVMTM